MRPKPPTARHQSNHASSSFTAALGSAESLSTKKWKRSSAPARSSERWIAPSPANTRSTGSSQMGITMAVRTPSAGIAGGAPPEGSRLVIAERSPRRTRGTKPSHALQAPIESAPKGAPEPAPRAPLERPLEAPGDEAIGGALRRARGPGTLFLNELAQRAQRLRQRVSRPLPRLREGALDRPGRERSVLLGAEPERREVGERARVSLPPVVEDAARGQVEV